MAAGAVHGDAIPLWDPESCGPRGPLDVPIPRSLGETINPDCTDQSTDSPELVPHLLPHAGRAGIIIVIPGGGMMSRSDRESSNVCRWLNSIGLHAALLHYRVQRQFPAALLDARRAVQLVRQHANAWGVDKSKVGVVGFSAGGWVAAMLAAAWDLPPGLLPSGSDANRASWDIANAANSRPDCAVLCYPVVTASGEADGVVPLNSVRSRHGKRKHGDARPLRHHGTCEVLLGEEPQPVGWSEEQLGTISAERWVRGGDAAPPPTFVWHTAEDATVPCLHAIKFSRALNKVGTACDLHIFAKGAHGLGLADGSDPGSTTGPASAWTGLCETWLQHLGWLSQSPKKAARTV